MLLELFEYITENLEPSQKLLDKLKLAEPKQPKLIEGLMF
jgi:hypothetical protein